MLSGATSCAGCSERCALMPSASFFARCSLLRVVLHSSQQTPKPTLNPPTLKASSLCPPGTWGPCLTRSTLVNNPYQGSVRSTGFFLPWVRARANPEPELTLNLVPCLPCLPCRTAGATRIRTWACVRTSPRTRTSTSPTWLSCGRRNYRSALNWGGAKAKASGRFPHGSAWVGVRVRVVVRG